jgi:hypothetical protein
MSDSMKKKMELKCVRRLFATLGHPYSRIYYCDRPDVIVVTGGVRIGVEVTEFHADEEMGRRGSPLRAGEEAQSRKLPNSSYAARGISDPFPGLRARIMDKTKLARGYRGNYHKLWLLIAAQLPRLGAVGATFIVPAFLDIPRMNREFHKLLARSPFDAAYLHLLMDKTVYAWSEHERWRRVAGHPGRTVSFRCEPWFQDILNDPEWMQDPDKKAREEACKAIDEIDEHRRRIAAERFNETGSKS